MMMMMIKPVSEISLYICTVGSLAVNFRNPIPESAREVDAYVGKFCNIFFNPMQNLTETEEAMLPLFESQQPQVQNCIKKFIFFL